MDTFTQEQLERAEVVIDNFATLPGTDSETIAVNRPSVEVMAAEIESKLMFYPAFEEAITERYGAEFVGQLEEAEDVPLNEISKKHVPNGDSSLRRHWKRLVRQMPKGSVMQTVGSKVIFRYETVEKEGEQRVGTSMILFDLEKSSKKDGIFIDTALETNSDGEVWDPSGFIPENTEVYFRNQSLMVKIIMPFRNFYGASTGYSLDRGVQRIDLHTIKGLNGVGETIVHEGHHLRDDSTYESGAFALTRLGLIGTRGIFVYNWLLKSNPMYLLPQLLLALGLYGLSRNPNNPIGKSFHSFLGSESGAYMYGSLVNAALENRGYVPGDINEKVRRTLESPITKREIAFAYQPAAWAAIDLIRLQLEEAEDSQPAPSLAYAV